MKHCKYNYDEEEMSVKLRIVTNYMLELKLINRLERKRYILLNGQNDCYYNR